MEKCSNRWQQQSTSPTVIDNNIISVDGDQSSAAGANNNYWSQDKMANQHGVVVHGGASGRGGANNHHPNDGNINSFRSGSVDEDYFPPGFRFCPLDGELVVHYLKKRIKNQPLPHNRILDVNIYESNPYKLTARKPVGDKVWYFFTPRDRKYRNGNRPNRAAEDGYWKATGAAKPVKHKGEKVGFKRALVFYRGKPRQGNKDNKTNWMMQEYGADEPPRAKTDVSDMRLDDWVLCKIYKNEEKTKQHQSEQPPVVEDRVEPFPVPKLIPSNHHLMTTFEGGFQLQHPFIDEHIIHRQPFFTSICWQPFSTSIGFGQHPLMMQEDIMMRPLFLPGDDFASSSLEETTGGIQEIISYDVPSTSFVDQYLNLDNNADDNLRDVDDVIEYSIPLCNGAL